MTADTFYEGLCDEHVKMQGRMQAEINRLRREKAALQQTLDEMPSTLTELQDRVTMLEGIVHQLPEQGGAS